MEHSTKFFNLSLKEVDVRSEDQRIIQGWATRPEPDRMGDIVIPEGAQFQLPLPFLLDHDTAKSVGHVEEVKTLKEGIQFTARIQKVDGDSSVARQCENAWMLIKHGLRRFVSIGFRTLESVFNEATDGLIITKWEWLELSAVTIPALASAEITSAKSLAGLDTGAVSLLPQRSRSMIHHPDSVFLISKEIAK